MQVNAYLVFEVAGNKLQQQVSHFLCLLSSLSYFLIFFIKFLAGVQG
jgi:hypothetical protein